MGAHHDTALLRLTEDAGKTHDRDVLRVDDVAQDVSRTDARQLVYIAHEYQPHTRGNGFQQIVYQ